MAWRLTLVARKITDARRLICASPLYLKEHGSPRVPADLLRHNCLTVSFAQFNQWPFHTDEGINRLAISGTFASDNADLLLDAAVAGLGIVRLADFVVARALQEGDARSAARGHPSERAVSDPCRDGARPSPRATRQGLHRVHDLAVERCALSANSCVCKPFTTYLGEQASYSPQTGKIRSEYRGRSGTSWLDPSETRRIGRLAHMIGRLRCS